MSTNDYANARKAAEAVMGKCQPVLRHETESGGYHRCSWHHCTWPKGKAVCFHMNHYILIAMESAQKVRERIAEDAYRHRAEALYDESGPSPEVDTLALLSIANSLQVLSAREEDA